MTPNPSNSNSSPSNPNPSNPNPSALTDAATIDRLRHDPATDRLAGLRARLGSAAADLDLLDVAVREVDTPFGGYLIAATPAGLVRVAFDSEDRDAVLGELSTAISPRILTEHRRTDPIARQLDEFFEGRRQEFDLPVDLHLAHGFRREVLDALRLVPYGTTVTYGGLATTVGNPRAVRAVGTACATNPIPIVVPCHRVLRSDGSIGRYRGGEPLKEALLDFEAGEDVLR